jgi:hypothetical protein
MSTTTIYNLAADALLLIHVGFVAFVVFGLLAVLAGHAAGCRWVRNPWFRLCHLVAIGVVVLQAWAGLICPLTHLESALRARAGDAPYAGAFVSHWLQVLLYYQAPAWVFALCYTLFGALVVLAWVWVRPRPFRA